MGRVGPQRARTSEVWCVRLCAFGHGNLGWRRRALGWSSRPLPSSRLPACRHHCCCCFAFGVKQSKWGRPPPPQTKLVTMFKCCWRWSKHKGCAFRLPRALHINFSVIGRSSPFCKQLGVDFPMLVLFRIMG
jgi:hypothetical protein